MLSDSACGTRSGKQESNPNQAFLRFCANQLPLALDSGEVPTEILLTRDCQPSLKDSCGLRSHHFRVCPIPQRSPTQDPGRWSR